MMVRTIFHGVVCAMLTVAAAPASAQEAEPEKPATVENEKTDEEKAAAQQGLLFTDELVVTAGRQ
jgi:ribosomal protein L12E/L44/L45/RPP1/RPP2